MSTKPPCQLGRSVRETDASRDINYHVNLNITQATWKRGIETVQATSTNPNAILNVFSPADGGFEFALTNEGGGKFEAQRAEVNEPNFPIIVESNFGGSDTATVTISS